jgi:alkylation response protein AidB-like acyl-CoA dehydrogenase
MDFRDTPEEAEYRSTLRKWLADNVPADWTSIEGWEARDQLRRRWHRALYEAGYVGQTWPVQWGGRDLSPSYDAILNEESGDAGAPPLPAGVNFLGRVVYTYASDEQKTRFLPSTLNGDIEWCQGFSEPGAGSDLAALTTRAVLDGDRYVVNGQKMWTSNGQFSDWCLLLARTDPNVPKHKGISAFLVDMQTPGITVRPIVLADGDPETTEVFWDDVEIPVDQRLGQPGDGWLIAMTTFSYERGPADIGVISSYRRALRDVEGLAAEKGLLDQPEVRKGLARAYMQGEVLRLNAAYQLSLRVSGRPPGPEGSVAKLLWAETEQALQHLVLDLVGADVVTDRGAEWLRSYFRSRPVSVYGGTSQIQRNLLSQRILGMPR